jgi:hypothetical protein
MRATAWESVRAGHVVNADAIIADAERMQPVALGVRSCRSVDTRAPQVVRSSPPMTRSGDVRQVRHCDRPQAGRLATRRTRPVHQSRPRWDLLRLRIEAGQVSRHAKARAVDRITRLAGRHQDFATFGASPRQSLTPRSPAIRSPAG